MSGYSADWGMSPYARRRRMRELGFLTALAGICVAAFIAWNIFSLVLFLGESDRTQATWIETTFRFKDPADRFHHAVPSPLESLFLPDLADHPSVDVMYNASGVVYFGRPAHLLVLYGVFGLTGVAIAMAGHEMVMRNQDPSLKRHT